MDKLSHPPAAARKFAVYQNPALSAALTSTNLSPSKSTFFFIFSLSSLSAVSLTIFSRENGLIGSLTLGFVSEGVAYIFTRVVQILLGLLLVGCVLALVKALSLWRARVTTGGIVVSPSKQLNEQKHLTSRQLALLGIKPKVEQVVSDSSKKPPKHKISSADALIPLHPSVINSSRSS